MQGWVPVEEVLVLAVLLLIAYAMSYERKRIDWRLVPFLCIMYLLAFLDRVNIANARSFHLLEDLGMEGTLQYNTGRSGS